MVLMDSKGSCLYRDDSRAPRARGSTVYTTCPLLELLYFRSLMVYTCLQGENQVISKFTSFNIFVIFLGFWERCGMQLICYNRETSLTDRVIWKCVVYSMLLLGIVVVVVVITPYFPYG